MCCRLFLLVILYLSCIVLAMWSDTLNKCPGKCLICSLLYFLFLSVFINLLDRGRGPPPRRGRSISSSPSPSPRKVSLFLSVNNYYCYFHFCNFDYFRLLLLNYVLFDLFLFLRALGECLEAAALEGRNNSYLLLVCLCHNTDASSIGRFYLKVP